MEWCKRARSGLGRPGDRVRLGARGKRVDAGRRVDFTVTAPYEATGRLAKQLKVSADLDGNFLRMELGGPDPALISATVNAVANRFVEVAAALKREKLTELARILERSWRRRRCAWARPRTPCASFAFGR